MRILVGITGGIAAYKSAELIRLFVEAGHEVRVVPTPNALRFIGSATLEALSHNPVHSELYDDVNDVRHIELAHWAELIVVAPATASFLARAAAGLADDLLCNVIMAADCPKVFAPAMHTEMWLNCATVSNVAILRDREVNVIEPASGRLTGTDTGIGRLPDATQIFDVALNASQPKDLVGKNVLVIAGGTREPVDAVRFIGNKSSGKQGLALADVAKSRGAEVTLIAANIASATYGIERIDVASVEDLQAALKKVGLSFDFILMPAAVSDYRVASPSTSKLKKSELGAKFSLDMVRNSDIIAGIAEEKPDSTKLVGFAAETESGAILKSVAFAKLQAKNLDLIVANDVSEGKAFDKDFNDVVIMSKTESSEVSGTKLEIANKIFDLLLTAK
jgi:phosphopantothenoylcysteine decarboxylase / phosphopantothenate---cysteine ligase